MVTAPEDRRGRPACVRAHCSLDGLCLLLSVHGRLRTEACGAAEGSGPGLAHDSSPCAHQQQSAPPGTAASTHRHHQALEGGRESSRKPRQVAAGNGQPGGQLAGPRAGGHRLGLATTATGLPLGTSKVLPTLGSPATGCKKAAGASLLGAGHAPRGLQNPWSQLPTGPFLSLQHWPSENGSEVQAPRGRPKSAATSVGDSPKSEFCRKSVTKPCTWSAVKTFIFTTDIFYFRSTFRHTRQRSPCDTRLALRCARGSQGWPGVLTQPAPSTVRFQ